jgi:hypothetical protein
MLKFSDDTVINLEDGSSIDCSDDASSLCAMTYELNALYLNNEKTFGYYFFVLCMDEY